MRNYSPRTISTYCHLLSSLQALHVPLDAIDVDAFKTHLHKRITLEGISVSVVNQSISAFKILQEDVLKRPWEPFRLKRPRREQKVPVVLSVGEVERIINGIINIKHRAIVMLAFPNRQHGLLRW